MIFNPKDPQGIPTCPAFGPNLAITWLQLGSANYPGSGEGCVNGWWAGGQLGSWLVPTWPKNDDTSKNTSKMHIILRWSILCAFLLFSTISLVIQSTKYRVQHVSDRLCLSSKKENFDAPHALKLNVQIRLFQAGTLNWLTNSN